MAKPWTPEIVLDPDRVCELIKAQDFALEIEKVELFSSGWDNTAFLVNDHLVFRFPHRVQSAPLMEREIKILPVLAPHLPLPIPKPVFVGEPVLDYPYWFSAYELMPGTTLCRTEISESGRQNLAVPLGEFLRALHGIPVEEATRSWAPGDIFDKATIKRYVPQVIERLRAVEKCLEPDLPPLIERLAIDLQDLPMWDKPTIWCHSDLYARHLLVDNHYRLTGVIDWGDVHLGDPALDLSVGFMVLPKEVLGSFRDAYGDVDDATWERARYRAMIMGLALVHYGSDIGDDPILEAGKYALLNVV